jgi:hypothetical protein
LHAVQRDDAPTVEVISRRDFLAEWEGRPGQHVTMIGPTQRGKTTFAHQLLGRTVSPQHKAVILAGKPPKRDPVMAQAAKKLNMRIVEEWPPSYSIRDRNRNGYVVRPHHSMRDLDADNANLKRQFRGAMMHNYASSKPVITVVDEAHLVYGDLGLRKEYEAPLMRGAPVVSQWSLLQRGRFVSYHAYNAPEHIFIFYDPDDSNVERYSEIGGVDPRYVQSIVKNLKTYTSKTGGTISETLYIRRSGPQLMIVDVE